MVIHMQLLKTPKASFDVSLFRRPLEAVVRGTTTQKA